jgi:hypothetical protein
VELALALLALLPFAALVVRLRGGGDEELPRAGGPDVTGPFEREA